MRWTVLEPGALCNFFNWLGKAQNWGEFRETMKGIWGPGQNVVYADVDGNIGYVLGAHVPVRKRDTEKFLYPGIPTITNGSDTSRLSSCRKCSILMAG